MERKKTQHNLDRQQTNMPASSSGYVSKCEFLTGESTLPEK